MMIVTIRKKDDLDEYKHDIGELIFDTQKYELAQIIKEKSIDHIKKNLVNFIKLKVERWFLEGAKIKLFGIDERLTGVIIYKEDKDSCRILQMNSKLKFNYPLLWFFKNLCKENSIVLGSTNEHNEVINKYCKKLNIKTKKNNEMIDIERSKING